MKRFFQKYTLISLLLLQQAVSAQNPLTITVQVNPPYSTNFEDYLGYTADNVIVTVNNSSASTFYSFYLSGAIEETSGTGIKLNAPPQPPPPFSSMQSINPGQTILFSGNQLSPFFPQNRLQGENVSPQQQNEFILNKTIPEGLYRICLFANDAITGEFLSNPNGGCSNIFAIKSLQPPIIIYPACNISSEVQNIPSAGQNISFMWTTPSGLPFSAFLNYTLEMIQVPNNIDPNVAFNATTYIPFIVSTNNSTNFDYNGFHPGLELGKRYAIRVKVQDLQNTVRFENNGYSEVCSFIYGLSSEFDADQVSYLFPKLNLVNGAQLFYFEDYLNSSPTIFKVRRTVLSANPTSGVFFTIKSSITKIGAGETFKISTKPEVTTENLLSLITISLDEVNFPSSSISQAFGNFENGQFSFEGDLTLLANYQNLGNKFILPSGEYSLELQLMTPDGETTQSVNITENFIVEHPYYIGGEIPFTVNNKIAETFTEYQSNLKIHSSISSYNTVQLPAKVKAELRLEDGRIIKPNNENCPLEITNQTSGITNISSSQILCFVNQFNANELLVNVNNTNSSLPAELINEGKLLLPNGAHQLILSTFYENRPIKLCTDRTFSFTANNGQSSSSQDYQIAVKLQANNPFHGIGDYMVPIASNSFNTFITEVKSLNSDFDQPVYLKGKIIKEGDVTFEIKIKPTHPGLGPLYIANTNWSALPNNNLNDVFANFLKSNFDISPFNPSVLEDLFPGNRLRLPPGNYKIIIWATNANGTENFSDPTAGVNIILGSALNLVINNPVSQIDEGFLAQLYSSPNNPSIGSQKTLDASLVNYKITPYIEFLNGPYQSQTINFTQEALNNSPEQMLVGNSLSTNSGTNFSTIFDIGQASNFLLDGQPLPANLKDIKEGQGELLSLPSGTYKIVFNANTPNLSFPLSSAPGASFEFTVGNGEPNPDQLACSSYTPPEFTFLPIYPANNDTLPFKFFPFISRFCPFNNKFVKVEGNFAAYNLGETNPIIPYIFDNNWMPGGPKVTQSNLLQFQVSEYESTHLPVSKLEGSAPEDWDTRNIFDKGKSYEWKSDITLSFANSSPPSLSNVTTRQSFTPIQKFGYGMTKPILIKPENGIEVEAGEINFIFKKGTAPQMLIPPFAIVQANNNVVSRYNGRIFEACVLEISKSNSFDNDAVIFRSEKVNLNKDLVEIAQEGNLSSTLEELYGEKIFSHSITEIGTYYWRVKWLKIPDAINNFEGYLSSSVDSFIVKQNPLDTWNENEITCSTTITNEIAVNNLELLNRTVCVGEFKMLVTEIVRSENQYTGKGIIKWKGTPFKVKYESVRFNSDLQLIYGEVVGERDLIPSLFDKVRNSPELASLANINSTASQVLTTTNSSIDNIYRLSTLFGSGGAVLPLGLNISYNAPEFENNSLLMAIIDMRFEKDKAKMAMAMDIDIPIEEARTINKLLELGALANISPTGFENEATFYCYKEHEFKLDNEGKAKLKIKKCSYNFTNGTFDNSGTYLFIETINGVRNFNLKLSSDLLLRAQEGDLIKKLAENVGIPNYVKFSGNTIISYKANNFGFIVTLNGPEKFGIKGLNGVKFLCEELSLDLSKYENPFSENVLEEGGMKVDVLAENPNLFKGIYLKTLKIELPEEVSSSGISVGVSKFLLQFSPFYFSGSFTANNLASVKSNSGWGISLKEIGIKIKKNEIEEAFLGGKVFLPIADRTEGIDYRCALQMGQDVNTEENNNENENIQVDKLIFTLSVDEKPLNASLLGATLNLINSEINLEFITGASNGYRGKRFKADATLNGFLKVKPSIGGKQYNIANFEFRNLGIATYKKEESYQEAIIDYLYFSSQEDLGFNPSSSSARVAGGGTSGESSSSEGSDYSGFPLSIEKIAPKIVKLDGGLGVDIGVAITIGVHIGPSSSGNSETEGTGDTEFAIKGKGTINIFGGTASLEGGDVNISFAPSLTLSNIELEEIKIGPVTVSGNIQEYDGDAIWGKGFEGNITGKIDLGDGNYTIGLALKFGTKTETNSTFKYLRVGVLAEMEPGIPIVPPVVLSGLGGVFGYNIKNNGPVGATDAQIDDPNFCGNITSTGLNLIPKRNSYDIMLYAKGSIKDPKICKVCLSIAARINNGRLAQFEIKGKVDILASDGGDKGIVEGRVTITYTNNGDANKSFRIEATLNTKDPLPDAKAKLDFCVWSGQTDESQTDESQTDSGWYFYLGQPDRANRIIVSSSNALKIPGIKANITTSLNAYFVTGTKLPAPATLPEEITNLMNSDGGDERNNLTPDAKNTYGTEVTNRINNLQNAMLSNQSMTGCNNGGLMFGAEYKLEIDITVFIIYFNLKFLAGFDLNLLNYSGDNCDLKCGEGETSIVNPGINGWYANGQIYAYLKGELGLKVDVWFFEGKIKLFEAEIAAFLQGAGPNPWFAKGGVFVRGEVLGGLVKINKKMDFKIGTPCSLDFDPLANIKIIESITPNNNEEGVSSYAIPKASFSYPVSEISDPFQNNNNARGLVNPREVVITYLSEENTITRKFAFALNRFEVRNKPLSGNDDFVAIGGINYAESNQGRPKLGNSGLFANPEMKDMSLEGDRRYQLIVEVEALEYYSSSSSWKWPTRKANEVVRKLETETVYFKTGPPPDEINPDFIEYLTPVHSQRNYHEIDRNRSPQILMNTKPNAVLAVSEEIRRLGIARGTTPTVEVKVRIIPQQGTNFIEIPCPTCTATSRDWKVQIPSLEAEKVYKIEYRRKWTIPKGANNESFRESAPRYDFRKFTTLKGRIADGVTYAAKQEENPLFKTGAYEEVIYAYYFRTSRYKTFEEKLKSYSWARNYQNNILQYSCSLLGGSYENVDEVDVYHFKTLPEKDALFPPLYMLQFEPDNNKPIETSGGKGFLSSSPVEPKYKWIYKDVFGVFLNRPNAILNFSDWVNYAPNMESEFNRCVNNRFYLSETLLNNQGYSNFPGRSIIWKVSPARRLTSEDIFKDNFFVFRPFEINITTLNFLFNGNPSPTTQTANINLSNTINNISDSKSKTTQSNSVVNNSSKLSYTASNVPLTIMQAPPSEVINFMNIIQLIPTEIRFIVEVEKRVKEDFGFAYKMLEYVYNNHSTAGIGTLTSSALVRTNINYNTNYSFLNANIDQIIAKISSPSYPSIWDLRDASVNNNSDAYKYAGTYIQAKKYPSDISTPGWNQSIHSLIPERVYLDLTLYKNIFNKPSNNQNFLNKLNELSLSDVSVFNSLDEIRLDIFSGAVDGLRNPFYIEYHGVPSFPKRSEILFFTPNGFKKGFIKLSNK